MPAVYDRNRDDHVWIYDYPLHNMMLKQKNMKIVVIDGQGGRMGSAFIDKWIKSGGDPKELIAVGTNAMATSAMMKAGAVKAATGENPVVVNTSGADFVVGPIGIIAADALLGEITPQMAQAVASCTAQKVLLPVNTCMFHVVGVSDNRLSDNIDEAISYILQNK